MRHHVRALGSAVAIVSLSTLGNAHISLDMPVSRYYQASSSQADQVKQKAGPCGVSGDGRTLTDSLISTYKPGETITVTWRETIQHPGHFRIAFDSDGQDFAFPGEDSPSGVVILADNIADKSSANYSQQVTLPDIECSNCTLQLIQVMTTDPPPYSATGDLYFNCADIVLKADAAGSTGTGGATSGTGGTAATTGGSRSLGGAGSGATTVVLATGGHAGLGGGTNTGGANNNGGALNVGGASATSGASGIGGIPSTGGMSATSTPSPTAGGTIASDTTEAPGGSTSSGDGDGGRSISAISNGGATAFGGATTVAASDAPSSADNSAAGTSGVSEAAGAESGCSCRVGSRQQSLPFGALSVMGLLLIGNRRRRLPLADS